MNQDHFIGVDVGTGSVRACIIDSSGEIKQLESKNIQTWRPKDGYYEQSTTDIWRAVCHCVATVVCGAQVPRANIRGIGFDATCSLAVFCKDTEEPICVTPVDSKGKDNGRSSTDNYNKDLIRNVVLWLDHRPESETQEINATKHPLLKYVGGTMSIEMEIPKVLWLKRNLPEETWKRCKFYDLADALTHLATGGEERSFCSTVCKQGYVPVGADGCVKGWQPDFYEQIGLSEMVTDQFGRIGGIDGVNGHWLSAGERVGSLSSKAAGELGLEPGIAVASGVIDAYAGWIGTVGAKVDLDMDEKHGNPSMRGEHAAFTRLAAVAGTSTCHLAMTIKPVFTPGVWGPYKNVVLPGYWMAEGGQSATGALLDHMLHTHPGHQAAKKAAATDGVNIYDYLNSHLEDMRKKAKTESQPLPTIGHLTKHIFFYGDLWGNRSPVANPKMAGSLVGMGPDYLADSVDSLALTYYATMEFIALQTRQIVSTMNAAGHHISSIFMSGSQCQNPILMDLIATACELPVVIPEYSHAAVVHGAAMLAVKAASASTAGADTESLWNIMERMTKPAKIMWPKGSNGKGDQKDNNNNHDLSRALLLAKYEVFLKQLEAQIEYRKIVDSALQR